MSELLEGRWVVEGPIEDRNYSIKFTAGKDPDGDDTVKASVLDGARVVAEVSTFYDKRIDAFKVVVAHNEEPGIGIGSQLYVTLDAHLQQKYKKHLASDWFRSPAAEKLWQGLSRRGLAKPADFRPKERSDKKFAPLKYYVFESSDVSPILEDIVKSDGLKIKYSEKEEEGQVFLNASVRSELYGVGIAYVRMFKDDKNKLFRIESATMDPDYQGLGVGFWAYQQIDGYVKKTYSYRLASDTQRSDKAEGLWKKLEKAGKAVHKKHPVYSQGYYQFK